MQRGFARSTRRRGASALISVALLLTATPFAKAGEEPDESRPGERLFYRMLGSSRNDPLVPRTRTIYRQHDGVKTACTGMAITGFTEYPFCEGQVSYSFAEGYAYFPRIASGVPISPGRTNGGDIVIDHVYEPDSCVWGANAREFVQTFVATGRELVSVTLLVASDPGAFRAALLENGPGGRVIGPVRGFRSGHSMEWGYARWKAGDAPLEPGRTYGIRLWREDGASWTPYLNATGNAYSDGLLYADGRPLPDSDLGAWIIEEPADLSRAIVEGADNDGWLFSVGEVIFVPRTPNVRLVSLDIAPALEKCREIGVRLWTTENPPKLVAGPIHNLACNRPGTVWSAHVLFTGDEAPVLPGDRYRLEVFTFPHKGELPGLKSAPFETFDIRAKIYGETDPGALTAIHDLRWSVENGRDLHLVWSRSVPCEVHAELRRLHPEDQAVRIVPAEESEVVFPNLWPGHEHHLRLVAKGAKGLSWRTPVYRILLPGGPHPEPLPPVYGDHPDVLVPVAPPPLGEPQASPVLRFERRVPVTNPGFENGLEGWSSSPSGIVRAASEEYGIAPAYGKGMAGWSALAGERREQVFETSTLHQTVPTVTGHEYLLSARLHTSVLRGPRGDTRVRLCVDPQGGAELGYENGTQWYWTDGRWLRFEHRFVAEGETATIAVGFFRWRDLDRASAYADQILLLDLGPSRREATEAPRGRSELPRLALSPPRSELEFGAEAWLEAPPHHAITGLGVRAANDNVTTLWLRIQPLVDGTLGPPEFLLGGREPDAELEARLELPEGLLATGFGARVAPESDVKTLTLWARPLLENGRLGEEREFRAGAEAGGALEKSFRTEPGRVLTGVGLRSSLNDITGIRASSSRLTATQSGRKR